MKNSRLTIFVKGEAVKAHRIALKDFIIITDNIQKALVNFAQGIVKTENKKRITQTCQLELINLFSGSLGVELGLRQQEEQTTLFEDTGEKALRLFLEGLKKLNEFKETSPELLKKNVLNHILEINKVFKRGINKVELNGMIRGERTSTEITTETIDRIRALNQETEKEEEQEILGILWEADWKDHTAELYTNLGWKVIVRFDETLDEMIKKAARSRVKLKGIVKFENDRPKEIKVKEVEFFEKENAFKTSEWSFVREPSVLKSSHDPFVNAKPIRNLSFLDQLPDDWDVDDFVQNVYRMREEDKD